MDIHLSPFNERQYSNRSAAIAMEGNDDANGRGPGHPSDPLPSSRAEGTPRQRPPRGWSGTCLGACSPTAEVREKLRQARGHEEQLDIFTREYRTASLKYAQRLACEHFTAEDVVHTMLCKIAARMAAHRDQVCRAWIIVCLRNASRDLRRKYRLPLAALDPEQEAQALDDFNEAHLEQVLQIIFAKLRRSVGADPIDRALFEDWVHYRLDRETDETALRELCGSHLSVRRHRFAKQYDPKLARMLSSAYDVDRLAEIQQALIRRRSKRRQCSEDERQPRARSQ